jgi:hypothetical protein
VADPIRLVLAKRAFNGFICMVEGLFFVAKVPVFQNAAPWIDFC